MCPAAPSIASNAEVKTEAPELRAASEAPARPSSGVRARLPIAVSMIQAVLVLVHVALYETWKFFWGVPDASRGVEIRVALAFLSVSFVLASLIGHQYFNPVVRAFYTLASFWLGLVNFLILAACACWIAYGLPLLFGLRLERRMLAEVFLSLGLVASICAIWNAAWIRVVRINVKLPNLPAPWRGRTAALVSDLHLGHIRNAGFLRRIVKKLSQLRPDILFIPGDLYDGMAVDLAQLAEPWEKFRAPLGAYFVTGNHEQFSSPTKYLEAVRECGIRVLDNEKVVVDGLQIVGVHHRDSTREDRFRSVLQHVDLDRDAASILLVHNPIRLRVAAEAGISLQLSGHTHRGQFFPWTAVVSRIYGRYAYGLQRFGDLAVYTSCGAGTWGPPMRLGTNPEIVLIHFE